MFCTVEGANAIIALRCNRLSDKFEDYWKNRSKCDRSLHAWQGEDCKPRGIGAFSPSDNEVADRRHRKSNGNEITKAAKTDLEQARAIYEWIVDNTFRDPKTRGCGLGEIRFMLESKDLGGKCADLNALYKSGACGGPPGSRRLWHPDAKSDLGHKSLGTSMENITKEQHCRAEVYVHGYGRIPVDPADVR